MPAAVVITDAPRGGQFTLVQGDSARLVSRVFNARRQRLTQAVVQWTSSDPARVVRRNGWAVALAPGGPVTFTAVSGPARSTVQVLVTPRAGGGTPAAAAPAALPPPSDAEVRAAADELAGALRNRQVDALARRLTERAADGTPTADFLALVRSAREFNARPGAPGRVGGDGPRRSFALSVQLEQSRGGFNDRRYATAVFYIALRRDGNAWRADGAQLARRVKF